MNRRPGLSARLKLTISYAGFLLIAGTLLLAVVWVFLLRYVPDSPQGLLRVAPNRYLLLHMFAPAAAMALAFLLAFGLLGGWILAGRMLAPLRPIADAARTAANGSLSHRIRMQGPRDEFRELADAFDTMLEQLESHVTEQQRFAANASHELRTPLAISKTLLDLARKDPKRDQGELIERLHTVNTRAIDLTDALLLLSRADRKSFTRESVDLSLIAEEAAETLLERLRIARETVAEVLAEMTPEAITVMVVPAEAVGDERAASAYAGAERRVIGVLAVPKWQPGMGADLLPQVYRDIVEVVADAPGPVRAKQIVPRIGLPAETGKIEGTRSKLKRLVERGWLDEDAPGLFTPARHRTAGSPNSL
ncbi:sensor histidine kinase [Kitasatospora sp. NPDC001660]